MSRGCPTGDDLLLLMLLLLNCRLQKFWICMEFCGAGSLQDIYQGERKGKGDPGSTPSSTVPPVSLGLCLLGPSSWPTFPARSPTWGPGLAWLVLGILW